MRPEIEAFLMAHACIADRDEDGTRHALRHAAMTLEPKVAERMVKNLYSAQRPSGKRFLSSLA